MTLVLLTGGARSGKSRLAVELASREGGAVTFLATGEAGD
jgi:adenosylcobinamide kinase/adenosylcobinamide-phosphate guanylyltransferase